MEPEPILSESAATRKKKRGKKSKSLRDTETLNDKDHDIVLDIEPVKPNKRKNARKNRRDWDEDELETIVIDEDAHEVIEDGSFFDLIPHSFTIEIFKSLDLDTLIQLSVTSKSLYNTIWSLDIWSERIQAFEHIRLSSKQTALDVFSDTGSSATARHYAFVTIYNEYKASMQLREEVALENRETEKQKAIFERWLTVFEAICVSFPADLITLLSIVLGFIFLGIKLEELVVFSWRIVLIPFLLVLLQFNVTLVFYDLLKFYYDYYITDPPGFLLWKVILVEKRPMRLQVYLFITCMNLSFIFLMIKMNEDMTGIHTGAVTAPIMAACLILSITMFIERSVIVYSNMAYRYVAISSLMFIVQMVFITLKAEGHVSWQWKYIFIPIWAITCLLPVFTIVTMLMVYCGANRYYGESIYIVEGIIVCIFMAPIAALFGLVSVDMDSQEKQRSWVVIMIPMFVTWGIVIVIYLIAAGIEMRRLRRIVG